MRPRYSSLAVLFMLTVSSIFIATCTKKEAQVKIPEVSLRQEWFANSNFAGAILAARDFASDHNIKIKIEEGSEAVDPVALVTAGHSTFGDAAADRVLAAIAKGAPLVIVGVINTSSPTVFLAKTENKIYSPKDWEGRKVGVLSGTATEYVYRALLRAANVDEAKINEVEADFDLKSFIAGNYEVRPAFAYDEPVSLKAQKIDYTLIDPRKYGVHFIGTVYFTRRDLIDKHPELVQAFIDSVADGWRLALEDPDRAIAAVKEKYPAIDSQRELESLKLASEYIMPPSGKILLATSQDWSGTMSALRDLGVIGELNLEKVVDNSFILKYLNSDEAP